MTKKILYISHSDGMGGAQKSLLQIVRNLDHRQFSPIVLLPDNKGVLYEELRKEGVRIVCFPLPDWVKFKRFYSLRDRLLLYFHYIITIIKIIRLIRKEKVDLVHTNTIVKWSGAIAAKLAGIPHVWHVRENIENTQSLLPFINWYITVKSIEHLSNRVIAVSNSVASFLCKYITQKKENKLHMIYSFIEFSENSSRSFNIRKELKMDSDEALIIYLGYIVPEKGIMDLVASSAILRNKNIDFRIILAGEIDTRFEGELNKSIKDKNLSAYIKNIGFRKNVRELLYQSDILVLPSLSEALSLSILESMACGRPVVATDCGGTSEIVRDGITGFLVPVGNSEKIAEALERLIDNKELARELGNKGREMYLRNFSREKTMGQIEEIYYQILEKE